MNAPQIRRTVVLITVALVAAASALALPAAAGAVGTPWDPSGITIAPGVTIAGVAVAGQTRTQAGDAVRAAYVATPVTVTFFGVTFTGTTSQLGQSVGVADAVAAAYAVGRDGTGTPPPASTNVNLAISVDANKVTLWVRRVQRASTLRPVSATWHVHRHRVVIDVERAGHVLSSTPLKRMLVASLTAPGAAARSLGAHDEIFTSVKAAIGRTQLGPVVIVDRSDHTATFWTPSRKGRVMSIAVGMSAHQTPLGSFTVVQKQKNPRWTPPNSEWAKDAQPIAPGPNNPLGTRWIGLSASGIGMHGTNLDSTVGHAVSHGCMRMHRRDVEWLFNHVSIGTPVVILR